MTDLLDTHLRFLKRAALADTAPAVFPGDMLGVGRVPNPPLGRIPAKNDLPGDMLGVGRVSGPPMGRVPSPPLPQGRVPGPPMGRIPSPPPPMGRVPNPPLGRVPAKHDLPGDMLGVGRVPGPTR